MLDFVVRGVAAQLRMALKPFRRSSGRAAAFFAHIVSLAAAESDPTPLAAPFVSLVVPVFNTPPRYLDDLVASVRAQKPGAWELILSDDGSTAPETRAWLDGQASAPDLRILRNAQNRGIAAATNAGVETAQAPWIGLLDHDDALAPFALERIWRALSGAPDCQFLYTDEVVADRRLRPKDFFLKPGFDPVLLSGVNYINHLSLYRREIVLKLGGLREGYDGSQDYDLVLRYTRTIPAEMCVHLPYPAYVWRRDGASYSAKFLERATHNARRALAEAYSANSARPSVDEAIGGHLHRIRFDLAKRSWPIVSVIIPNLNSVELTSRIIGDLIEKTDYPNLEIIVIDNGANHPNVATLYENLKRGRVPLQVITRQEPLNFSHIFIGGLAAASGELVLLLNNDIEILQPYWLREMVSCFDYPNVGVVGAKLLYPNRTIQHVGMIVGFGGRARHWYLQEKENFPGPAGRLWVRQSLTAVAGACFLISKDAVEQIARLNNERFANCFADVDLCMRAREAGLRVVWTPFATLVRRQAIDRIARRTEKEAVGVPQQRSRTCLRDPADHSMDFAISPWYTLDRPKPEWARLARLPGAR